MFEESTSFIPSIWASMNSWFTPTVLFVLLNLMIGTIAITSRQGNQQQQQQQQQQRQQQQQQQAQDQGYPQLDRSPSVLQRLKSFSNYYRSPQPTSTTGFDQTPVSNTHYTLKHTHQEEQEEQSQLTRSPSLLHRLRSINFHNYLSPDSNFSQSQTTTLHKTQDSDTHYTFQQHLQEEEELEESDELSQDEEEEEEEQQQEDRSLDEIYMQLKGANVYTSKSDAKPTSGAVPTKLTKKIKKSMSVKLSSRYEDEEDINSIENRRPATVREGKVSVTEDEEVDAKADDFINKFKQQLKLQRLDSLINWSGK